MRRDGILPSLPTARARELADRLFDIGPVVSTAMGASPIDWRDIAAWQEITGVVLPPWQARVIRGLSSEYLVQQQKSVKPDCPAPFTTRADVVRNREALANKLLAAFKHAATTPTMSKKKKRRKGRG